MALSNITPGSHSSSRPGARLRIIGVLVLLLGLGGAGVLYWTGAPPEDLTDDVATARTSKKEVRAIEVNVGKMGVFMDDLLEDWQNPGTKASTIVAASIFVASGCFYFARLQARGDH